MDDEFIIREGIVNTIPWGDWGFEVVGQGKNGLEALELIEKYQPQVILTDIKMPDMDGIQLINRISEQYSEMEIIILSGYSEIDYYRKAIKCSVVDYLLKPTCYDDFYKVAQKVKKILDQKQEKAKEHDELKRQLLESLPYMRQLFLKQLLSGLYTSKALIQEKEAFYNIQLFHEKGIVIALSIDNLSNIQHQYSQEQHYLLKQSLLFIANQLCQIEGHGTFFMDSNYIVGIYDLDSRDEERAISFIQEVQKAFYELKKMTVSAGVSDSCSERGQLQHAYSQSIEALKQRIYLGESSITCYKDIMDIEDREYLEYTFDTKRIIDYIFYNGTEDIHLILDEVFNQFSNKLMKKHDYIDKLWYELNYALIRYGLRFNIEFELIMDKSRKGIKDIGTLESLSLKRQWIIDVLQECRNNVLLCRDNHYSKLISKIKAYVDGHFCDNAMSLSLVADVFQKNTAYISSLFKKETGENFSDYIIRKRMDRAKELLEDFTIKTYEVAEAVGYADTSHFIKVFKKYTGMSTSQYRERLS